MRGGELLLQRCGPASCIATLCCRVGPGQHAAGDEQSPTLPIVSHGPEIYVAFTWPSGRADRARPGPHQRRRPFKSSLSIQVVIVGRSALVAPGAPSCRRLEQQRSLALPVRCCWGLMCCPSLCSPPTLPILWFALWSQLVSLGVAIRRRTSDCCRWDSCLQPNQGRRLAVCLSMSRRTRACGRSIILLSATRFCVLTVSLWGLPWRVPCDEQWAPYHARRHHIAHQA